MWGVGTFTTADGVEPFPVSTVDFAVDTAAAGRALDSLGIGPGDRVLVVGLVSECAHLVPFHEALRARGAILSGADATLFDAPRTAKLIRQLEVRGVVGVNAAILDGLAAEGFDVGDVFAPVPVVVARPGAVERLQSSGVDARLWAHVGPAVAVECRPGAGAHVDGEVWDVIDDGGEIVIDARRARALPPGPYRTGLHAALTDGPCACGRTGPRLVLS